MRARSLGQWVLCIASLTVGCRPAPPAVPVSASRPSLRAWGAIPEASAFTPGNDGVASATPGEANPERQDYDGETEAIGDDDESPEFLGRQAHPTEPHPLESLSKAEIERRLKSEPESLGAASLGRPNAGRLFNAVQLPEEPQWKRVDPAHAWATPETIEYLSRALRAVAERYPGTAPVSIGHLSARHGGPLRPHVSHQSGRDVDVGFYYSNGSSQWYKRASDDNLDLERTWWLIRTLVLETDIEMILLDQSLSRLVERVALESGDPREWVEGLFHTRQGRPPIVRHASGHATHLHLRFFNPIAQETGRLLMPLMVERKMVAPPQRFVNYVARNGDTLAKLAARYSTTMQAIREANSMKTYQLVAGASYRIPAPSRAEDGSRVKLPSRRAHPKAASQEN